jgi:hypothetical protein
MGFDIGSGLGAGLGSILGGAGGSKPAGTTTRTEDVPDWLKPFYQSNLSGASTLRDSLTSAGNPLLGESADEMGKTIRGDYLNPDSNPYLAATGRNVADMIGRSVDSRFSSAGRYGSNAFQDTLGTNVGKALTDLYGTNYAAERGRQVATQLGTPGYVTGSVGAQFAPYMDFHEADPRPQDDHRAVLQEQGSRHPRRGARR